MNLVKPKKIATRSREKGLTFVERKAVQLFLYNSIYWWAEFEMKRQKDISRDRTARNFTFLSSDGRISSSTIFLSISSTFNRTYIYTFLKAEESRVILKHLNWNYPSARYASQCGQDPPAARTFFASSMQNKCPHEPTPTTLSRALKQMLHCNRNAKQPRVKGGACSSQFWRPNHCLPSFWLVRHVQLIRRFSPYPSCSKIKLPSLELIPWEFCPLA